MVGHHPVPSFRSVDGIRLDRQREDDKHRRHEEKEALRREKERRRRERIKKRELAQACERDRQAQFQTAPANHVPRSVSPYQTGGQPPGARPVSPHHPGGQLPGQRHVSTYQLTGTLPAPDQLPGQRPVFPYQGGGQLPGQRPVSPYHDGGALPNTKPIFPHHGGDNLPPAPASTYYFNPNYGSAYNEVEGGMGDLGIGGKANECHSRKKNTGYQPAPGGDYPLPNACYAATIVWFGCKYNGSAYQFFQEEATVALPESFNRIPSPAWAFTPFNEFKIQDLDRLEGNMPRMPKDIDVHDVLHVDWIRFMLDLTGAWIEQLPIPESAKQNGRPPERRDVVTGVVEDWNKKFFFRRGIEAIVYKGRERITDKYAGRVDTNLPDFNFTAGVTTDSGDDYASPSERRERWEPKKFRELGKLENKNKYTLYLVGFNPARNIKYY